MPRRSDSSVFVGSIPYDATEEQLKDIFSEVGPVVSFRLLIDRETGKPKGYGFCEYQDPETALSAIRNLNNYQLNGRQLRVDFADRNTTKKLTGGSDKDVTGHENDLSPMYSGGMADKRTVDEIVDSKKMSHLYEILNAMKQLAEGDPQKAKQFLLSNPSLAYALLQSQVVLGMVDPATVQSVLGTRAGPPKVPPPNVPPATLLPPKLAAPAAVGFQPLPGFQGTSSRPIGRPPAGPPPSSRPVQPPPAYAPPPSVPDQALLAQQMTLIQQVIKLTPQQIEELEPQYRAQVQGFQKLLSLSPEQLAGLSPEERALVDQLRAAQG